MGEEGLLIAKTVVLSSTLMHIHKSSPAAHLSYEININAHTHTHTYTHMYIIYIYIYILSLSVHAIQANIFTAPPMLVPGLISTHITFPSWPASVRRLVQAGAVQIYGIISGNTCIKHLSVDIMPPFPQNKMKQAIIYIYIYNSMLSCFI